MRLLRIAPAALAALACAAARPPDAPLPSGLDDAAARASLERFARDLEQGRFEDARRLLSSRWRDRYTPGQLALDFGGGPAAREQASQVLAALAGGAAIERSGPRARLPVGEGRAALLVDEGGAWRVDALE